MADRNSDQSSGLNLTGFEKYVEYKWRRELKRLPIKEFSDKLHPSFMAFVNSLKAYLRQHEYSDRELISIIQDNRPPCFL